jgi:hypothetical protein
VHVPESMQQFLSLSEEHSGCSIKGAPTLTNTWYPQLQVTAATLTNTWYPQLQVTADLVVIVVFIIGIKKVADILVTQAGIYSV